MTNTDLAPSLRDIVTGLLVPGEITILPITGQAGAGKTNYIVPMIKQMARENGFWVRELALDAFFILSSEERSVWLAEGERISPQEGDDRKNQLNWWNFSIAMQTLETLQDGKPVCLNGIYNRADKGRLTGNLSIEPPHEGLLLFEGVAVAHLLKGKPNLYIHAPRHIRFQRLLERDKHRGLEEAQRRFELTESFEKQYFRAHWPLIDYCIDNSNHNGVKDLPQLPKPELYDMD